MGLVRGRVPCSGPLGPLGTVSMFDFCGVVICSVMICLVPVSRYVSSGDSEFWSICQIGRYSLCRLSRATSRHPHNTATPAQALTLKAECRKLRYYEYIIARPHARAILKRSTLLCINHACVRAPIIGKLGPHT